MRVCRSEFIPIALVYTISSKFRKKYTYRSQPSTYITQTVFRISHNISVLTAKVDSRSISCCCSENQLGASNTISSAHEWASVYGLKSNSTHNRSFQRQVFPCNQLHWYWQPETIKHNTTYTRNTQEKQKKTALANKTIHTLIWYGFYYLRSGNGAHTGLICTCQCNAESTSSVTTGVGWGMRLLLIITKTTKTD